MSGKQGESCRLQAPCTVKEDDKKHFGPTVGAVKPGALWAFIAVMGVTGAGKSTFIKTVSEDETVVIGEGLESCMLPKDSV